MSNENVTDDGECLSCAGGKCTTGPECVALSNPVCSECGDSGEVMATDGSGPYRCYACRPEDWIERQATGDPVTDGWR